MGAGINVAEHGALPRVTSLQRASSPPRGASAVGERAACLLVAAASAGFAFSGAHAYEASTHAELTRIAVERSQLTEDPSLLSDIGLNGINARDYGGLEIEQLLVNGVVNEDFVDRDVPIARVLNHFYDPQYDQYTGRGLDVYVLVDGQPSPDWALEDRFEVVSLSSPLLQYPGMPQDFSFRHVQQQYFEALTGQGQSYRLQSAGRMFQYLGHVVHHIQDMAQPQHARNDPHGFAPSNHYEAYTVRFNQAILSIVNAVPYSIPQFDTARQYWYSVESTTDRVPRYIGMAEYSAHNFVTYGTPYTGGLSGSIGPAFGYPLPNGTNPSDGTAKRIERSNLTVTHRDGSVLTLPADYVVGRVYDPLNASVSAVTRKLATTSVFDGPTRAHLGRRTFGLSPAVWDDNYPALFPRAVGFSAGLIDHLFRGRLNVQRHSNGTSWVVQNTSRSGQTMLGELSFWYEGSTGLRYPVTGGTFQINLASGATQTVNFTEPPSTAVKLIAAFRGKIGLEGSVASGYFAVAGKVIDYSPSVPPCTGERGDSGGYQGINYVKDMGGTAGQVEIVFEAYSIPDGLVVRSQNAAHTQLATTNGLVSGLESLSFPYDPAQLGSSKINVIVTGNTDTRTAWNTVVGCPGQDLPSNALPKRSVTFSYGSRLQGALGACTADVYIDATYRGTASAGEYGPSPITLTIGPGHGIQFLRYSCQPGTRNILVGVSYTDATGTHALGNMSSTNVIYFDVH